MHKGVKRAFEKYGFDNFVFEMICICFDEDLDKFEIQYMTKFNSIVPNGYNLRAGTRLAETALR